MLDPVLEQKMDAIAEQIFGTQHDPEQIPITHESGEKLEKLTPNWIRYELDERGEPIAWVIVVPTTRELAERFLRAEISERQLLDMTRPQEKYSALYFCAAVTVPEHRRKGLAVKLLREAIESIPQTDDGMLFAWPYSPEGRAMIERWNKTEKRRIFLRE